MRAPKTFTPIGVAARRVLEGLTVDRLFAHRDIDAETGCWNWTGSRVALGYGQISIGGRLKGVHRAAYEALRGAVPDGLVLDHLCRNPSCFNPDHLEPVSHRTNVLRGVSPLAAAARATHCKRGHAFDEENTRVTRTGTRKCRACDRARVKRNYDAARSARRC